MLAEQALGEAPLRRKQVRGLEFGVHPHYRREMVILDAVAGRRVVWDDFPAAAGGARCRSASDEISERTPINDNLDVFQSCDKFELCDAVNLLTLWFRQSIGDYVVPDWHTEF